MHIDVQQLECLTEAIYFEARGETPKGQELVAQVIKNRVNNDNFPDSYCAVINQKGQFTYKRNLPVKEPDTYKSIKEVALNVMNDKYRYGKVDNIIGYHNLTVTPRWTLKYNTRLKVGNHVFYGTS